MEERDNMGVKMPGNNSNVPPPENKTSNQKTCSNCGSVIPAIYDVCPVCGAVLKQGVHVNVTQDFGKPPNMTVVPPRRKHIYTRWWFWLLVVPLSLYWANSLLDLGSSEEEEVQQEEVSEEYTADDLDIEEPVEEPIEEESVQPVDISFDEELAQFQSGGYAYITNEDLNKYAVNMSGVKVYIVTELDDFNDDGELQSTLSGYMMSSFDVGERFSKYESGLVEDDVIAIAGTVGEVTDYSFMGQSVSMTDCIVFAAGDDAEAYRKDTTDASLAEYMTVTEDVASANEDEVTEDEYKALCKQLDYTDILRNPDSYKDSYCVVSGTVSQVIEGWFGTCSLIVEDSSGNRWDCTYYYEDGETRHLEGDSITVYGKCDGTTTSETLLGKQVVLPYVSVEYIG